MSEAQSGIARNSARPMQDLSDTIRRHVDLSRQFRRAHIERFQFFGQVFTRMNSSDCHRVSPSDSQQSQRYQILKYTWARESALEREEQRSPPLHTRSCGKTQKGAIWHP